VYDWLIVGAGFAGSALAERIANELKWSDRRSPPSEE
jgi:flavin-dependent dehydrogenase